MRHEARITVCSVMRDLSMDAGSDTGKRVAWSAGSRVRDLWEAEYDRRPEMRLVQKTSGSGTHDKAVYPESWRGRIEEAIYTAEVEVGAVPDPRQVGLFG